MSKRRSASACVLRVHRADTIGYVTISEGSYRRLLAALNFIPADLPFRQLREALLTIDIGSFVRSLTRVLCPPSKKPCPCLILEMLDKNVDVDLYDDFCYAIVQALSKKNAVPPSCIVLTVSNPGVFKESQLYQKRLLPLLKKKNVFLLLVSDDATIEPEILFSGNRAISPQRLPSLEVTSQGDKLGRRQLSPEDFRDLVHVLNGHFVVSFGSMTNHATGIIGVARLGESQDFLEQIRGDVAREFNGMDFVVYPIGIPSNGVNNLAIALVDGRPTRLIGDVTIQEAKDKNIVILCDVVNPAYHIPELVSRLNSFSANAVVVCSIGKIRSPELPDSIRLITYVDLPIFFYENAESCIYCSQDIGAIEGSSYNEFELRIAEYDPVTFWQLVAQDQSFFNVGHWSSDRTPNHYHFRVLTEPIFHAYASEIGLRIRNSIRALGIMPKWVRRIVIPDEPEPRLLGKAVASALGLQDTDIIGIPRRLLRNVAGPDIGKDLMEYIEKTVGTKNLDHANVLIVDQAAHHFRTLSALHAVCDRYDATILGFAVFIDRTPPELAKGEFLHDTNYLALYSWPSAPRRSHECPCAE